ncbi:MAG: DNA polymerase III PolC-type [Anaerolineales bacterium]|nr:DNA polymerase III PolC-type [Anaerolineales bacterium]
MNSIVAIDIETTGLDKDRDAIIEIGAVRFNGKRVEDEFSTLVNPGKHIPEFITGLTGIDDSMVRQAPRLNDILHELQAFAGDAPVIGHNVRFDLGFLQKANVLAFNRVIDTYALASVLMPAASRYNLGALGQQLGILLPATHRALDDARVTHAVYERLLELARELPLEVVQEIVHHGEPIDWDAGYFFEQVLRAKSKQGVQAKKVEGKPAPALEGSDDEERGKFPPLKRVEENAIPLNDEEIASALEYGGPFSQYFDNYEHRPEQVQMLRAVTNSLSYGRHMLIEAGTGVGKSFAYLVPAAYFAMQNNTRVVVSTNTINLQDQLIKKDIPALKEALGLDLRAAVLKGRANYLCPRRLQNMRRSGPNSAEEMRVLAKVIVWQLKNASGDRNELNLTGPAEREAWMKLSADDDACTTETCLARMAGTCPFHRAKTAAQNAHILIVNHALLLSDVATGSKVLPEYDYLVVDEAHHLESATTSALSFKLSQFDLARMLKEIGNQSSGLLGRMIGAVGESLRPSDRAAFGQLIERATSQSFRLDQFNREFFNVLAEFAAFLREGQPQSNYAWQARIQPPTRKLAEWEEVEMTWGQTSETWRHLLETLEKLYRAATDLFSDGNEEIESPMSDLSNLLRRMSEAHNNLTGLILDPSAAVVYWIEVNPRGDRLSLNAAPLHVGNLITEHIWNTKNAVTLASATLTTHGEFNYLRNRLGAEMADELALGSPFDYESSTLLFIGNDMPEPNQPNYEQMLNRAIASTAIASGGRMLVLFTSYAALKRCAQGITAPLARENIFVLEQGEGASANTLLESFKSTERAVLLGTKSFWEGVDVPGEALSVVVITKLPFDVPTDPLIAARSETYEDPFNEYYLPEAILKFRQGFGRLIRTQSDRGVVVILDKRVMTKQYGRMFLESLPQCTVRAASIANLPREAGKWLGV